MLRNLLSQLAARPTAGLPAPVVPATAGPAVLNVGGNSKSIAIPGHYADWSHVLLDIDPRGGADVVCDARELATLPAERFDAVYCSHNLEHYYAHEVRAVLAGFVHVLAAEGFAEIRVPDLAAVFRKVVAEGMDLEDTLYEAPAGPISVLDVIYGYRVQIEQKANPFFAHKTGFTARSLCAALAAAGFAEVWEATPFGVYEIRAVGFKRPSTPERRTLLGLPLDPTPEAAG
jgi:hypothetical protein